MADTFASLTAQIAQINAAIGNGVLSIRHGDEQVTYKDLPQQLAARTDLEQRLALLGGLKTVRGFRITTCKGL